MNLKVEVKNSILGDSVFWEGPSDRIDEIMNICARELARLVAKDGQVRKSGMWLVSVMVHGEVGEKSKEVEGCARKRSDARDAGARQ